MKITIEEIIDRMLNNGLDKNLVPLFKDLISQRLSSSGLTMSEAVRQIEAYIESGKDESGELSEYIEEVAIEVTGVYQRMVNQKLMEKFNHDGLLMTGSLIDISSPQCRYVIEELAGKITRENWPKVREIAKKNGLMEGTTFDNLPFNLLHKYCRHSFFPTMLKKSQ